MNIPSEEAGETTKKSERPKTKRERQRNTGMELLVRIATNAGIMSPLPHESAVQHITEVERQRALAEQKRERRRKRNLRHVKHVSSR